MTPLQIGANSILELRLVMNVHRSCNPVAHEQRTGVARDTTSRYPKLGPNRNRAVLKSLFPSVIVRQVDTRSAGPRRRRNTESRRQETPLNISLTSWLNGKSEAAALDPEASRGLHGIHSNMMILSSPLPRPSLFPSSLRSNRRGPQHPRNEATLDGPLTAETVHSGSGNKVMPRPLCGYQKDSDIFQGAGSTMGGPSSCSVHRHKSPKPHRPPQPSPRIASTTRLASL